VGDGSALDEVDVEGEGLLGRGAVDHGQQGGNRSLGLCGNVLAHRGQRRTDVAGFREVVEPDK
jgi:hypothetical protein